MVRLFFKVFDENDLQENMNGQIVSGFITSDGNKQPGIVQLGKEVNKIENYKDKNTSYKIFKECILYVSITEEDARNRRYQSKIEGFQKIRVYH